jgi:tetratricopeptide (TPR) repeat protein
MQDDIVTHLAHAMDIQLSEAEAARLKRTPSANPSADDLALQCVAGVLKGGLIGKEADAGYRFCEQALADDPNNVRALSFLAGKVFLPIWLGSSADPKADIKRGNELVSKALAIDPNYAPAHVNKANLLMLEARNDETIAEGERALALDPAMVDADAVVAYGYLHLGEFEKSIEYLDKAIRLSPHDPVLGVFYGSKAHAYFALKRYDQSIEWDRRSITISPDVNGLAYGALVAALALTGREAEAREALQRYLALPSPGLKTIAAFKALEIQVTDPHGGPRFPESWDRMVDGLRKAGMPEQ